MWRQIKSPSRQKNSVATKKVNCDQMKKVVLIDEELRHDQIKKVVVITY